MIERIRDQRKLPILHASHDRDEIDLLANSVIILKAQAIPRRPPLHSGLWIERPKGH